MPNVCVIAYADGDIDTIEMAEWPELDFIQEVVGGYFAIVPTSFQMEYDESWGDEAGTQDTVVYCNEEGMLKGLEVNRTTIAEIINGERRGHPPLLGDLLIVSGDAEFLSLDR